MLHPRIVAKKIARLERKFSCKLTYHTVEQCAKVDTHFRAMTRSDGKSVGTRYWLQRDGETEEQFQYQKWEREWIDNELLICQCDFRYWFYRYFFLKNKENRIVRPDKLIAQEIFLDIISVLDLLQLPMLIMILKARQLGISTVVEAIILWIALFRKGSHCVIASAEEKKSVQLSEMVWDALENLPVWMRPVLTREDRSKGPEFGRNGSDISLEHGTQTKGIARGSTPVAAHVSEAAYYPNPVATIESSLFKAMHENRRTFLPLESTANKKGDWWHRFWIQNREGQATGYNRCVCIFLPWYVGSDKYPTVDWLRNHPIPPNWKPMHETLKQAADAKLYVHTAYFLVGGRRIPLSHYMGEKWEMPVEQMWWYEFHYVEASREDAAFKSFLAECAADERTCFQSKKHSVYSWELLDKLKAEVDAAKYTDYALVGNGVPDKFQLRDYWDHRKQRIEIAWASPAGENFNWRLIPLRETPAEEDEQLQCYIRIWRHPEIGYSYGIGIDVGGGVGEDYTVADVIRKGKDMRDPDMQVAQLYCNWISSPEVPPFALALGIYYGRHMSPVPEALMAPETQVATGDPISHQLSTLGYTNFHYMRRYDQRKHGGKPVRRGWATLTWSRQMMLETLKQAVEEGWLIIHSIKTLWEFENWESEDTDSGKAKYDHADGENDDSIFATGIGYFTQHDEETLMERIKGNIKPRKPNAEKDQRQEPAYTGVEGVLVRHFQEEERRELGGSWRDGQFERSAYSEDEDGIY